MGAIDVNRQAQQIRALLVNALTNVTQALEAGREEEGTAGPEDAPTFVRQMQQNIAKASVLASEWDQAYYDGSIPLPGQEALPGFEEG